MNECFAAEEKTHQIVAQVNLPPAERKIKRIFQIAYDEQEGLRSAELLRSKVTLDGSAPGDNCGSDTAPDGTGEVREPRLYQLIRQKGPIEDRTFEIEFLDPGVHALDFTFG